MIDRFTAADTPLLNGRTFLVTGANAGLGLETARILAKRGGKVLLGCRSEAKAKAAMDDIRLSAPEADLHPVVIDLADLASVRAAASHVASTHDLDVLVNNAGVMVPPLERTKEGFELQFGTNHLGTFALTGLLLPHLKDRPGARVVITASLAHRRGRVLFDDVNAEQSYNRWERYAMSKLANLLHMTELDRRLRKEDCELIALACHPGIAETELMRHLPAPARFAMVFGKPFLNSASEGAWSTLAAATATGAEGGDYIGPARLNGWKGSATKATMTQQARDPELAARLWDLSERMTGVTYPV